ncbi:MAG: glycoside hydrolase family 16 protein [Polyangiaceae bacterium]
MASLIGVACSSEPSNDNLAGVGGSTVTTNGGASSGTGFGTTTANVGGATSLGTNAGGAANVGGSGAGTSGGATSASNGTGAFSLLFRDDFDSLEPSRWKLMTHSWSGNLAKFSAKSASVANGELSIALLEAPQGTVDGGETKPYLGAEVRSVATLTYGRVRARAKLAKGGAVVSALVTIYTPWPADNWNELDIEYLGKKSNSVQFNTMVYTGTLPAASTPVSPTQDPHSYDSRLRCEFGLPRVPNRMDAQRCRLYRRRQGSVHVEQADRSHDVAPERLVDHLGELEFLLGGGRR